ncbi:MAG: DMT family transporter [Pseudomonadota bacterium]
MADAQDAATSAQQASDETPPFRTILIASAAMIGAVLGFTMLDAVNKVLVKTYNPFFLSWARSAGQVLILLALIPLLGAGKLFRTNRPLLQVARGFCIAGVSLSVTLAVRHLPLVETYVIGFLAPFLATVIASIVLAERATPFQWGVITAGFVGVLIALRPGTPEFSWPLIYPVAFAVINSVYFVLTRLGARTETPEAQLFYVGVFATAALSVFMPFHWEAPTAAAWGLISLTGLLGTTAHILLIYAFSRGATAVISPMVYTQIIWSAIIGYVVFDDVPLWTTWIGAAVVVIAGIALIRSQAQTSRRARPAD